MEEKLKAFIKEIKPVDAEARDKASKRQDMLTKPQGSLGILEDLSVDVAGMTRQVMPPMTHKTIFTLAGDHGVAAEGVSAYPAEVTPQMVLNFLTGGAGINVLSRQVGAKVVVVDMGVNFDFTPPLMPVDRKVGRGTAGMLRGPAMTREQALQCVLTGIELVTAEDDLDMLGTGDMGIGNTTPSAAIAAVMTRSPVAEVTGRGTGLDDQGLAEKIKVIEQAIRLNQPNPEDALDVLAKVGGFEIGGLAGVIIGGACRNVPVVIDGFISGAAALIACGLAPAARDYILAAHQSVEIGHRRILDYLGLRPLLNLDLRLGEGTGAALAMFLVESAVAILKEMATFEQAGVSNKE
jgi:nicotinate-nucleotide--dimethylbenzimidazole phosphoribosyltransferase